MGLYLCRWQNGDFSVVQASNKEHAIEMLDEVANAEGFPIYVISDFMVHFRLTDDGEIELEAFGEEFGDHIRERIYPALGKLDFSPPGTTPEEKIQVKEAVELERHRVKPKPAPEPETELGKRIKAQTDLPTSIINRQIRDAVKEKLGKFKPKGKPS